MGNELEGKRERDEERRIVDGWMYKYMLIIYFPTQYD